MTDIEQAVRDIVEEELDSRYDNVPTRDDIKEIAEEEVREWADYSLGDLVADQVQDYLKYHMDIENECLSAVESALDGFPDDESGRCSLGMSFTYAVRAVLHDDLTKKILSEAISEIVSDPDFLIGLLTKAIKKDDGASNTHVF